MMYRKIFTLIVVSLILAGCASSASRQSLSGKIQDSPQGSSKDKVGIMVVPVGAPNAEFASTKGAAFGLIGALIELAVTGDKRDTEGQLLTAALIESKVQNHLAKQLGEKLKTCGFPIEVHAEVFAKDQKKWMDAESPLSESLVNTSKKSQFLVEVGIQNLWVNSGIASDELRGAAIAKIYKADGGKFVEKFRDYTGMSGHIKLAHYSDTDSKKKTDEVKSAAKSVIDFLATNIGNDICNYELN